MSCIVRGVVALDVIARLDMRKLLSAASVNNKLSQRLHSTPQSIALPLTASSSSDSSFLASSLGASAAAAPADAPPAEGAAPPAGTEASLDRPDATICRTMFGEMVEHLQARQQPTLDPAPCPKLNPSCCRCS